MPICACLKTFQSARSFRRHLVRSNDPKCIETRERTQRGLDNDSESESEESDLDQPNHRRYEPMHIDPNSPPQPFVGDFYGDHYQPDDFPGFDDDPIGEAEAELEEENPPNNGDEGEDEDEDEDEDEWVLLIPKLNT